MSRNRIVQPTGLCGQCRAKGYPTASLARADRVLRLRLMDVNCHVPLFGRAVFPAIPRIAFALNSIRVLREPLWRFFSSAAQPKSLLLRLDSMTAVAFGHFSPDMVNSTASRRRPSEFIVFRIISIIVFASR